MKPVSQRTAHRVVTGMTLAVIAMAALVSTRYFLRMDLTGTGAYTVSRASEKIWSEAPENIRITYYVSSKLEQLHPAPGEIKDLLLELSGRSRGKAQVSFVDPDSGSKAAESKAEADRYGIQPRTIQADELGEVRVISVYSGIVVNYLDRSEVIPWAVATETLEYDLARLLKKVVSEKTRVAGVLVGDPDKTLERDYQQFSQTLKQGGFEVRPLTAGQDVSKDVTCVFVLGNSGLDDFDLYPVDRYLGSGGSVFFAVKGVNILTQYGLQAMAVENRSLLSMLDSYGVKISPELVLDRSSLAIPASMGKNMITLQPYPHWVAIQPNNASVKHPVTSRFTGLDLYWPSPVSVTETKGLKAEPFLSSTANAWKMKDNFSVDPQASMMFAMDADRTKGQYVLGVSLEGQFPSWFGGKPVPKREGATASFLKDPAAGKPGRALVVSSADFLTDIKEIIYYQAFGRYDQNPNFSFLASAADWLGSDEDIMGIRSRAVRDVRLNLVKDKQEFQARVAFAYGVTLGLVPLLVVGTGALAFLKRRKSKTRQYKSEDLK